VTVARILVDQHVPEQEAAKKGQELVDVLIRRGVIQPIRSARVYGGSGRGYAPGPDAGDAWTGDVPEGESTFELISALGGGGVLVRAERLIVHAGDSGEAVFVCPGCSRELELSTCSKAISQWLDQSGPATVSCKGCRKSSHLLDFETRPQWGFGNLSLEFWDWPPFSRKFIHQMSQVAGHQLVVVDYHL